MRSVTSRIGVGLLAVNLYTGTANADVFREVLRKAAIDAGIIETSKLFDQADADLAPFGKPFFESKSMSLNGSISCQQCHLTKFGSADGIPNAIAIFGKGEGKERALSGGKILPRNTLAFWGRGGIGFKTFFWDGKVDFSGEKFISQFGDKAPSKDPLITAVHLPPVEIREMLDEDARVTGEKTETIESAARLHRMVVAKLRADEPAAVKKLAGKLGKSVEALEFIDVARSLAAFIRSEFRLRDTRFHNFVFDGGELEQSELKGGLLFYGKGKCSACHNGPYFSDFKFHAIPMPQLGFGKNGFGVDYGRFNVTFNPDDLYKFRTPPLLNVDKTAPFGHSGSVATLREAIIYHFDPLRLAKIQDMVMLERHEFYKRLSASASNLMLIAPLSDQEVDQLVAFLKALSF
jgi:cytochrome c peroxidase